MSELGEHLEALRRDPTNGELADRARALGRSERAFAELAAAFAERGEKLALLGREPDAIGSWLEAALLFEEELEDLPSAAAMYQRVLDVDGGQRRALFALGLLLHDLARWDDLIALYRRRQEGTDDDGERTTLHLYVAEILADKLDDANSAFGEVLAASRLAPKNIRIINRLEKLGAETGRVDEVAVVIGDLILHQDDPRVRAALSLRLAELHLGPLASPERALAYLRAALADDGGNPEILSEIEDAFRERARFDDLALLLEDAAKDRRVGPHRVRLERELARLYELELGDKRRALLALTRAARSAPDDRELLDEVMRLGLVTQDMDLVAQTFEEVCARTENALLRTYMRLKLGHIYAVTLARPSDAARVYWAILDEDPLHKEAQRRLLALYERQQDHGGVARVLEHQIQALEGPSLVMPLRRLAGLRQDHLDDRPGAVEAWRRILQFVPNDPEAVRGVSANEEEGSRPTDRPLAERVGTSAVATGADEQPTEFDGVPFGPESETDYGADVRTLAGPAPTPEVSTVRRRPPPPPPPPEDEPDDDAVSLLMTLAEEDLREAGEIDPSNPRNSLPRLEVDAIDDDDAVLVAPVLEDSHGSPVATDDLVLPGGAPPPRAWSDVVPAELPGDQELEIEPEPAVVVMRPPEPPPVIRAPDLVHELSRPAIELPQPSRSQPLLPEIDPVLRAKMEKELDERIVELQQQLQEATRSGDEARVVAVLMEIARIHERLGHDERAFFAAVRLAQLRPSLEVLEDVIRLGRRARGYPLLAETVEQAGKDLSPEARVRLGLELVEVALDDLGDVEAASRRLAELSTLAPDDVSIFERYAGVLERHGKKEELVRVLVGRAERLAGTLEALSLIRRAAQLRAQELGDPAGAAQLLMGYLARAPEREDLFQEAAGLLERAESWGGLVELLGRGLDRREEAERAELRLRIARVHLERLADPVSAERTLRAGLEERAREPAMLELLEKIYEDRGQWAELADVLLRRLEVTKGPRARNAIRRRVARVAEEHTGELELALTVLVDAVQDDPADLEALTELERLRRARADWDGVLEVLVLRSRALAEPVERAQVMVTVASLHADVHGDLDAAAASLRDALAVAPNHDPAFALLAAIEERRGDFVGAIDVLESWLPGTSGATRAQVLLHMGRIYEEALDDPGSASAAYQAAYESEPSSAEAVLALLRTRELARDYVQAQELAAHAATLVEDERQRAALWKRAAAIAHERIGDERRALEYYEKVLELDPDDLATTAALGELLLARQEYARAYPHLERAARGLSDLERTASLFVAAGQAAEKLKQRDDAVQCYEAALTRAPRALEPLKRLSVLAEQARDWGRAYEHTAMLLLHHEGHFVALERSALYLRMARAKLELKDFEPASRLARKAHQLADHLLEPLQLLADALAELGDGFEAAEALKRLAQLHKDPREKRNALHRAAILLAERAQDIARASAMLAEAQTFAPEDIEIAERLATYRERLGDAMGAAAALATPARLLSGRSRADLLVRGARIALGSGRDRAAARRLLQEAVEIAPTHVEALPELAAMLDFDGEHELLLSLWERAAQAFQEDPSTTRDAPELDRQAGVRWALTAAQRVARLQLGDVDRALAASARLLELGANPRLREEHARLLERAVAAAEGRPNGAVGNLARQAAEAWSVLVEAEPGLVEGWRRIHALAGLADDAPLRRIAAELLEALGERPPAPPEPPAHDAKPPSVRQAVVVPEHASEAEANAELWTALGHAPLRALYPELPEPKPKKKDLVGTAGLGIQVARPLEFVAALLGVEVPPVFVRDDAAQAITPALVLDQPGLIVSLALAQKLSSVELRFLFGRAISLLRPRALSLATLPLDLLRDALAGFARPAPAPETVFADAKLAKKRGKALEKALASVPRGKSEQDRAQLAELVGRWLNREGRRSLHLDRAAVLRTAERAGLVAAGSLLSSLETLRKESDGRTERAWQIPLLQFAASRAYAELVRRAG